MTHAQVVELLEGFIRDFGPGGTYCAPIEVGACRSILALLAEKPAAGMMAPLDELKLREQRGLYPFDNGPSLPMVHKKSAGNCEHNRAVDAEKPAPIPEHSPGE